MENFQTTEDFLQSNNNDVIQKIKEGPIKGIVICIIGCSILFSLNLYEWSTNSIFQPLLLLVGALIVVFGIVKLFYRKRYFQITSTKQRIYCVDINFNIKEKDKLISLFNNKNFDKISELTLSENNTLQIKLHFTKDKNFCFAQVWMYVPFSMVAQTNALKLNAAEAEILLLLK